MSYKFEWTNSALRDLKKLKEPLKKLILKEIDEIIERKADIRKLTARKNEWKHKVKKYMILLRFDKTEKTVYIDRIRPRRDVYDR